MHPKLIDWSNKWIPKTFAPRLIQI
jgi:hypothetical protein